MRKSSDVIVIGPYGFCFLFILFAWTWKYPLHFRKRTELMPCSLSHQRSVTYPGTDLSIGLPASHKSSFTKLPLGRLSEQHKDIKRLGSFWTSSSFKANSSVSAQLGRAGVCADSSIAVVAWSFTQAADICPFGIEVNSIVLWWLTRTLLQLHCLQSPGYVL